MNLLITMPTALFIFFLLLSFIIGFFVCFAGTLYSTGQEYKTRLEDHQEQEQQNKDSYGMHRVPFTSIKNH